MSAARVVAGLLFVASATVGAAGERPIDPYYDVDVRQTGMAIEQQRAQQRDVLNVRERLVNLIAVAPDRAPAYAQAARFLVFNNDGKGWPGRNGDIPTVARGLLDDAQSRDPRWCDTYWIRAQLEFVMKDAAAARAAIDAGDAQGCRAPWLEVVRARLLMASGDAAAARPILQALFDAGPGLTLHERAAFNTAATQLFDLMLEAGEYDALRAALSTWSALDDGFDGWAQSNMSYVATQIGEFAMAIRLSRAALTVADFRNGHNTLALALFGGAIERELERPRKKPTGDAEDASIARQFDEAESHNAQRLNLADMLSGSPCCTSERWIAALARHRERNAVASPR